MPTTRKRRVQRSTAKLNKRHLLDLPLDVIVEVFQHLEPLELLSLARTTKVLRAFLLDRHQSPRVWQRAIDNVGLPRPCPEYLCEPAYAHLTFEPVCHVCFGPCDMIDWELRMRCCDSCSEKMPHRVQVPNKKVMARIDELCIPMRGQRLKLYKQAEDFAIQFIPFYDFLYRPSDLQALSERAESVRLASKFVHNENEQWKPIIKHAELCSQWERRWLGEQLARLKLVRKKRVNAIKRKLKALGFTHEFYYYTERFMSIPTVMKLEPLTRAEWSEISPKLIALLSKVRRKELTKIYRRSFKFLKHMVEEVLECMAEPGAKPRLIDVFLHPDVREVIQSNVETISRDWMSREFEPILPAIMLQWCFDAEEALEALVQRHLGPKASTHWNQVMIECIRCEQEMKFSNALSHQHLYANHNPKRRVYMDMGDSDIYDEVVENFCRSLPRNLSVLQATIP